MVKQGLNRTIAKRYLESVRRSWIPKHPNDDLSSICGHDAGCYLYIQYPDVDYIHFEWVVWLSGQPKGCIEVGLHFEKDHDGKKNDTILDALEQYAKGSIVPVPKGTKFSRDFPNITWATRICLLTVFVSSNDAESIKWAVNNMEIFCDIFNDGLDSLKAQSIIP